MSTQAITQRNTVQSVINGPKGEQIKERFDEILGKKSAGFISSMINLSNTPSLKDAQPMSIISSAVVAATLDLPIDPNLGFAYVVPYNDKNKGKIAQFQMGYKGFIQLAIRTGQYQTINAVEVYEGEIEKINRLTGEIKFSDEPVKTDKIIGYIAYFKLLNGFEKTLYMSKEEMERHAKKYSQTYKSKKDFIVKKSLWSTDFDSMATKTVLKLLISKYGILSIEMQDAIKADQAVIKESVVNVGTSIGENVEYVDNQNVTDVEYEEAQQEIKEKGNKEVIDVEEVVQTEETEIIDAEEVVEMTEENDEEAPY